MVIAVIILAGVISVVLIGVALSTLTHLNQRDIAFTGIQTEFHMESCVQEALIQLKRDTAYAGATIVLGEGNCTIAVSGSDNIRTIQIIGTLKQFTREVTIMVTLSPWAITDWGEP
ncbi:MAG TPA: hypothetical protein DCY48_00565 [Candidatus Magasanikbacteria bacterium]|nr:MAG: hypothetical protein A3I74_02535 [Candidatus Magasanikbacteria bacterium RIFCSPLOWO2_02_FULL_47_16]OGH79617.1 MAG: hypothetical protein A3C10_00865 [Candidatus Magasanikbacteria bacterium RIFCSPHIGHO2_02_FULL_48_18]HAZ28256.1 hypothetical protein [Candidatus Magasanikbacteria bacterium]